MIARMFVAIFVIACVLGGCSRCPFASVKHQTLPPLVVPDVASLDEVPSQAEIENEEGMQAVVPATQLYEVSIHECYPEYLGVYLDDSVEDWLKNYPASDPRVNSKHFPVDRQPNSSLLTYATIFHFDVAMSKEDIFREMKAKHLKPADVRELMAFAHKHPNIYWEPLMALGSSWYDPEMGAWMFPYVEHTRSGPGVKLWWNSSGYFPQQASFLAVCE